MGKIIELLRLELAKFRNNSVVSLFGLMFLVTFPTLLFVGKEINNLPPPLPGNSIFFEFPTVWDWLGYMGNWLVFFLLAFIVMHMITSEVGYKTMRQNIISGMTRKDYFLGKVSVVFTISIIATLMYAVLGLAIGYFHNDPYSFENAFSNAKAIPMYFLMTLGYLSFALMIGFVFRKSGIAIFLYVSYISIIEPILKWGVHFKLVKHESINYWPMNVMEDLTPFPFYAQGINIPIKDLNIPFILEANHAIVASIIYICMFFGIAYYSFMRRDL